MVHRINMKHEKEECGCVTVRWQCEVCEESGEGYVSLCDEHFRKHIDGEETRNLVSPYKLHNPPKVERHIMETGEEVHLLVGRIGLPLAKLEGARLAIFPLLEVVEGEKDAKEAFELLVKVVEMSRIPSRSCEGEEASEE